MALSLIWRHTGIIPQHPLSIIINIKESIAKARDTAMEKALKKCFKGMFKIPLFYIYFFLSGLIST